MRTATSLALLLAACGGEDKPAPPPSWGAAFEADSLGWLLSAWGPSADRVYAVGGSPDTGLVMRWDGASWSKLELGLPDVPLLNWVYGFGPDDITFVGSQGTVLHYDGQRFTRQDTPTDQDLWGVWGASPRDLWAVGGRGRAANQATILHYDGTAWTKSSTPTLSRPSVLAYFKVWGTASHDVWAVGQRGALVHWDGARWSEVESGTAEDLVSLWGTRADRILAVGGRDNGVVVRYDGTRWTPKSLAPLPGLNGVWMRNDRRVHIGGVQGTLASLDFDSLAVTEETASTTLSVHALFGIGARLYAVGGSLLDTRPPHKGVALVRDLAATD